MFQIFQFPCPVTLLSLMGVPSHWACLSSCSLQNPSLVCWLLWRSMRWSRPLWYPSWRTSYCFPFDYGFIQGIARTQSPTNKNYAFELPTFGVIVGVSRTGVQWSGLALEEPPSWSRLTSTPGKYAGLEAAWLPWGAWPRCGPRSHSRTTPGWGWATTGGTTSVRKSK